MPIYQVTIAVESDLDEEELSERIESAVAPDDHIVLRDIDATEIDSD